MSISGMSSTTPRPNIMAVSPGRALSNNQLSQREKEGLEKLKRRDVEVKQHEQAHIRVAGSLVKGAPQYNYVIGPDGKRYATGGGVKLDTSEAPDDPKATIQKAQTIKRAALAPIDPSLKDRRVAAEAYRMELKARQELRKGKEEKGEEDTQDTIEVAEEMTEEPKSFKIDAIV